MTGGNISTGESEKGSEQSDDKEINIAFWRERERT